MMAFVPVSPFSDNCHCENVTLWLGWPESPAVDLASPGDDPLMLNQQESLAPARAAVSGGTSQKLLHLLRQRLRQLARVTLVLAICIAVAAAALGGMDRHCRQNGQALRWLHRGRMDRHCGGYTVF
jgi:hypothetical protein